MCVCVIFCVWRGAACEVANTWPVGLQPCLGWRRLWCVVIHYVCYFLCWNGCGLWSGQHMACCTTAVFRLAMPVMCGHTLCVCMCYFCDGRGAACKVANTWPVVLQPCLGWQCLWCVILHLLSLSARDTKEMVEYDFETVHNIDIYGCELAPRARQSLRRWNMTVQFWLANYVHRRVPHHLKSHRSAIWPAFVCLHTDCCLANRGLTQRILLKIHETYSTHCIQCDGV